MNRVENEKIGLRLKACRKHMDYTLEQLAEKVNVSPQFLAGIESGKKGMSFHTLDKLCSCLCISADYLLFGQDEKQSDDELICILQNVDKKYYPHLKHILRDAVEMITDAEKEKRKP